MKKSSKQSINKQKILQYVLLTALLLSAAYYIFGRPIVEKARFEKLDKEAYEYIRRVASQYNGEIEQNKSCHYRSWKYSKGNLSCSIKVSTRFAGNYDRNIVQNYSLPRWGRAIDSTQDLKKSASSLAGSLVFDNNCSITQYNIENQTQVSVYCSGSALREYYPLKTNP